MQPAVAVYSLSNIYAHMFYGNTLFVLYAYADSSHMFFLIYSQHTAAMD